MREDGLEEGLVRLVDSPDADPALQAMLRAAEQDLPPVDVERIVAGVSVGGGGGGGASGGPKPLTWALLVAGNLAAGALISLMLGGTDPAPHAPQLAAPVARTEHMPEAVASPAQPEPTPDAVTQAPAPEVVPPSTRRREPRRGPALGDPAEAADDTLDDVLDDAVGEGTLLLRARRALAQDDLDTALGAVIAHEHRYPRGRLSLEREAIAVDALSRAGQRPEARDRARALLERWPNSPYTQAAREVLDGDAPRSEEK